MNNNFREDYQGYRDFLMHSAPNIHNTTPEKFALRTIRSYDGNIEEAINSLIASRDVFVVTSNSGQLIDLYNKAIQILQSMLKDGNKSEKRGVRFR